MNSIISSAAPKTMTSIELVAVINEMRETGTPELAHSDFLKKIVKVLGAGVGNYSDTYVHPQNGQTYPCYRLPKREASLMVMSESYAVQAKVYDRLAELESAPVDLLAHLPAEQRALIAVMVDNADIKRVQTQQAASMAAIEQRIDLAADTHLMLARPAASESIVHIRTRINKQYGLPDRIINEIIRQSPYAPKPAGMVKNANEAAQGNSYAVYWIKDVSAVFARFVGECVRITTTQVTHPLVDGRFKLNSLKET
jgi:hypothetical protein